jgi:hypothetical protein
VSKGIGAAEMTDVTEVDDEDVGSNSVCCPAVVLLDSSRDVLTVALAQLVTSKVLAASNRHRDITIAGA